MTRLADMPLSQQAGILCNDIAFRRYAATRNGYPGEVFSVTAAAEHIRTVCKITTRRALNTNPDAAHLFEQLRTDFDAFRGRIANPTDMPT